METLDNILSGQGEAMPAPEVVEVEKVVETVADTPEPEAEVSEGQQKTVPHEALHAEKQKNKRYTEQLASVEQKLAESDAAWERRMAQLMERFNPPQQQPQAPPDWFENPNAAAMHAVGPHLDRMEQVLLANAKLTAGTKFGDDKVDEAEKAFIQAVERKSLDPADYHKVVNSPNRYAAAVQWHARQQAQQEIGDDPAAYKERLRAQILEELKTEQPAPGTAPVMPSNLAGARNVGVRAGPAWAGPRPLSDIFKR